ncbi:MULTISPECIES: M15 family metallopeptidase [Caproicibacterium]|uniref:M15 family metallopeptidase n=1 Tax=Caproicibacterium argilliputei TaxID=3030016 RepID=A0AA97H2M6_9FIRM|nr:M15 family metallopeptidase [Caproicibacterium argilliputei]WOC31293.1 M15 family metallopeptidase [Caproicibacterium argilliputei]
MMRFQDRRRKRETEEEERTRKYRKKTSRMSWGVCLMGLALLFFYQSNAPSTAAKKTISTVSSAVSSTSAGSSSSVAKSEKADAAALLKAKLAADWRLILVSQQSPLPKDFTVVLTKRSDGFRVDARIEPELQQMISAAAKDGVTLKICSAYRSVSQQEGLYHPERYASGSPVSVQPAGDSEHHTGLALDFITSNYHTLDSGFAKTAAYTWLLKNSWKYGFVLRYPQNKEQTTGVIFEPWHYRYVGKTYAKEMTEKHLCLEEYRQALGI